MFLRIMFEDLCHKLKHIKESDIYNALKTIQRPDMSIKKMINEAPLLKIDSKRNNFFVLGEALSAVFTVGTFLTHSTFLKAYKDFVE